MIEVVAVLVLIVAACVAFRVPGSTPGGRRIAFVHPDLGIGGAERFL